MKSSLIAKRVDLIGMSTLALLTMLSFSFTSSPITFMNPGFPILVKDDLEFSEKFLLSNPPNPKRVTNVYDVHKVRYEAVFHMNGTYEAFSDTFGDMSFTGYQFVTRFSDPNEAEKELYNSYQKYTEYEGDFPTQVRDIPLVGFTSKADQYLLWCVQYSREPIFQPQEVTTCYYWSMYGPYLSQVRLSMGRIGNGSHYPLELFNEIITRAERKILTKPNSRGE